MMVETLQRHNLKLITVSSTQKNLLHKEELSIILKLERIDSRLIILQTHQLHILLFSHTVRHLLHNVDVGLLFIHMENVQVTVDAVFKLLFIIASVAVVIHRA